MSQWGLVAHPSCASSSGSYQNDASVSQRMLMSLSPLHGTSDERKNKAISNELERPAT